MGTNEGIKKVFQTKLTATSASDLEGIGVIRFEGSRVFKYVSYNKGTSSVAAVADEVVVYHGDNSIVLDSAADVTMDISDGLITAGVLQAVIADGEFGWIQTRGVAILNSSLTGGVDGDQLTSVGASDGTLDVVVTGAIAHIAGYALDASAKIVLLECPW